MMGANTRVSAWLVVATAGAVLLASASALAAAPPVGGQRARPTSASASASARAYPKVFAAHQIDARYHFTAEHFMLEGARRLLAAGVTTFKFQMSRDVGPARVLNGTRPQESMLELVTARDYPIMQVLDLPFDTFIFWPPSPKRSVKEDTYELAAFLIDRYAGSGKTFMFGNWKADYLVRERINATRFSPHPNASTPLLSPAKRAVYIKAWQEQQAAVDEAKAHAQARNRLHGVNVWSYVEINLMRNSTNPFTVIDDVVPLITNPPIDFISVSLSTMPEVISSPDPRVVAQKLHPLLDHVASRLPPKPLVPGPRVFIGEYEFALRDKFGRPEPLTPTPELQARYALATLAAGIGWGVRHCLWWEFMDNTRIFFANGSDIEPLTGRYQDRGFGLVTHDNKDSVLWTTVQKYISAANEWLEGRILAAQGRPTCRDNFRAWALSEVVRLSNGLGTQRVVEEKALSKRNAEDAAAVVQAPPLVKRGCDQL